MLNEEREVRMKGEDGTIGEPSVYETEVPESYAEATEMLGEAGAFSIFLAGLKVKQDNVARNAFRSGKSQEEVEQIVASWRPGGQRTSKKAIATKLMIERALDIQGDPDLNAKVVKAFISNDWDAVTALLQE